MLSARLRSCASNAFATGSTCVRSAAVSPVSMGSEALDGVNVFNSEAKQIGRIELPERCANVCFGGVLRNRLFMATSTSIFSLYVNTQGVAGG